MSKAKLIVFMGCVISVLVLEPFAWAEPGALVLIASVRFENAGGLDYDDLSRDLSFRPGDVVSKDELDLAIRSIENRGVYSSVSIELQPSGSAVEVVFHLQPKTRVSRVYSKGNYAIDSRTIRRRSRIQQGAFLESDKLAQACEIIRAAYRDLGFKHVVVEARVSERGFYSADVVFDIDEGYQARIVEINLPLELPPVLAKIKDELAREFIGEPASDENLKELRLRTLVISRNEGYLEASADVEKLQLSENGDIKVLITLELQEPLTIVFSGNQRFTEMDLLAPLGLTTRRIPFSANIGHRICRDIVQMYENEGYFFARASCSQGESVADRQYYYVKIEEGQPAKIGEIAFEGNDSIPAREIREVMQTEVAGWWFFRRWQPGILRKQLLIDDLAAIEALYHQAGFYRVQTAFRLTQTEDLRTLGVVVEIREGPRSFIDSVTVRWKDAAKLLHSDQNDASVMLYAPDLRLGEPFVESEISRAGQELDSYLLNKGYPNSTVSAAGDPSAGNVEFFVAPEQFVRIGRVTTTGNLFSHDALLIRELQLLPGEPFSEDLRLRTEQRLAALGIFRTVSFEPADGAYDSQIEDMVLSVTERETGSLETGLTFDTQDGLRITTELSQRNLEGLGETLVFGVDGYFKQGASGMFDAGRARVAYTKPHLFDSNIGMQTEGFVQTAVNLFEEFSYDRVGASFRLVADPAQHIKLTLGPLGYLEKIYDVESDVQISPDDSGTAFYSTIEAEVSIDLRDDSFNTRRGTLSTIKMRYADRALGSDVSFAALDLSELLFTPLSKRVVWVNRIGYSVVEPFDGTDVVPISQRLFLGGRANLRGYSRNSVGPRGELNNVAGGDTALTFSTELQRDITESFFLAVFLDSGVSYLRHQGSFTGEPLNSSDLSYSPGIGFRYRTPIGALSVDFAAPLETQYGEKPLRLNFGIGLAY